MNEESQEELLASVRAAQKKIQDKVEIKDKVKKQVTPRIHPQRGEVIDEDRKTFDKYMKDARGKKAQEKLPLLRKATKIHKELPDEDKK